MSRAILRVDDCVPCVRQIKIKRAATTSYRGEKKDRGSRQWKKNKWAYQILPFSG